jgi:hypothetical protein
MTRTRSPRRRRSAGILLAALLPALAACGGGSGDAATVTTSATSPPAATSAAPADPTTATSTTPSVTPSAAAAEPAPTDTRPRSDDTDMPGTAAVLTEIRTADRGSYDRVVLEFDRPFGGWNVQYVDEVTEDPTGDPVPLRGDAALVVVVQGATLNNVFQTTDDNPLATYDGPRRVRPDLPAVKEVADAGDFEAVLSFGIGTASRTGFKVLRLTGPDRLVVDVAH